MQTSHTIIHFYILFSESWFRVKCLHYLDGREFSNKNFKCDVIGHSQYQRMYCVCVCVYIAHRSIFRSGLWYFSVACIFFFVDLFSCDCMSIGFFSVANSSFVIYQIDMLNAHTHALATQRCFSRLFLKRFHSTDILTILCWFIHFFVVGCVESTLSTCFDPFNFYK